MVVGFRNDASLMIFYATFFCILFSFSKIKIVEMISVIKPFRFLLLLTFCFQYLSVGADLFSFDISRFVFAFLYTFRFVLLICFSALFSLTTSPIDIVRVLHLILSPFRWIGIDVQRFSLSALVALRFIPVLFKESSLILDRLKADKKLPKKGFGVIQKLDLFLNPLFDRVFHYTDRVALFLGRKKDWSHILVLEQISSRDKVLFAAAFLIVAGGFFV